MTTQLIQPTPVLTASALDCGCDARMHRPVMFETLHGPGQLHACMKCGGVCYAESRGDDGRFTGEPSIVYAQLPIALDHLHWLSQWPRITVTHKPSLWFMHPDWCRDSALYLPSTLRRKTPERLAEEEVAMRDEQETMTLRERLRWCGVPSKSPPTDLPQTFARFSTVWQDLQLSSQSDPQHLIERARDSSIIAAEMLMQRRDAHSLLMQTVREGWLDATLLMQRAATPPVQGLEEALIGVLDAVPMTPHDAIHGRIQKWARVELALLIIAEQHLNSAAVTTALRAFMRKVARHDADLVNCLRITLRELEQPVPA